jgi:hypothetical protein
MNKSFVIAGVAALFLAGCGEYTPPVRDTQADVAARQAQTIDFSAGNAEISNITKRGKLVARPDLAGYIVLISSGRPVAYYTVKGKVTSGGKRLESPSREAVSGSVVPAPSYDGTFGSSDDYVYFWTTSDQYIQWSTGGGNGYIYSDQPLTPNGSVANSVLN